MVTIWCNNYDVCSNVYQNGEHGWVTLVQIAVETPDTRTQIDAMSDVGYFREADPCIHLCPDCAKAMGIPTGT